MSVAPAALTLVVELLSYLVVILTLLWRPEHLRWFVVLAIAGFLGEESSIWLYNYYGYSDYWLIKLHWTPLAVVLVWPVVILSSYDVARRLCKNPTRLALVCAALILYDTLMIEPVATAAGLWWWKSGSFFNVPLLGLFGWGLFGAVAIRLLIWADSRPNHLFWLPFAIALITQLLLAPMVFLAVVTNWTAPLSHSSYAWLLSGIALALCPAALYLRQRSDVVIGDILPKIAGAAIFFGLLYLLWFEELVLWCSLIPLAYWPLAGRLKRPQPVTAPTA